MDENFGYLTVRTLIADAVPIEGARVRIIGTDDNNKGVIYSVLTDRDGITERLRLPAPPSSLALLPSPDEVPYYRYDVEVTREGFYPRKFSSVNVYAGVDTVQNVNMIPLGDSFQTLPRGTVEQPIINRK